MPVPGFSNTDQNNRITVTIRKQGENVQVFIGPSRIAEHDKAISDTRLFDAVSFDLQRQAGPSCSRARYLTRMGCPKTRARSASDVMPLAAAT